MIQAKVVADSLSPYGDRLTSLEVIMPRPILAEFNTHRMFTRNSASSRAIPYEKMLEMVTTKPFVPMRWQKGHKGMQGTEYFESSKEIHQLESLWETARARQVIVASDLYSANATKQIINRLLEPFMYHKVLVSATEWENFYTQRRSGFAEIHMKQVADCIYTAMEQSTPVKLEPGEWHIPYTVDSSVERRLRKEAGLRKTNTKPLETALQIKIGVARCARVSYTTIDAEVNAFDYTKDLALHDKLKNDGHWSPFEHCARVMTRDEYYTFIKGRLIPDPTTGELNVREEDTGWCNNFRGFIQYRYLLDNGEA